MRNFMLFLQPLAYFKYLRTKYKDTYLAEDEFQVIIGIDCECKSSLDFDYAGLEAFHKQKSLHKIAPFAGLFGIFSYNSIHFFENINAQEVENYYFPEFYFCDARAYLHYDKASKIYSFYGDFDKYFSDLLDIKQEVTNSARPNYKVITDFEEEQQHFAEIFAKAREYLAKGDVFQVVLSEQLQLETNMDSLDFYEKLIKANPSPYMYFFPTPYGDIVGSSPELVVLIKDEKITIEPIAGTRGRGATPQEDERLKTDLLSDEKELCEHKMLVDLARNDIGKFAKAGTVKVESLIEVVSYEYVMHLVSKVTGKKREDVSLFDVISVVFPAGTLSGTPKIRALQIINELELVKRNAYGGGLGFLHYNGEVQLIILIRSAFFRHLKTKFENEDLAQIATNSSENKSESEASEDLRSEVFIQAGAGIVFDSVLENEYKEIQNKRASVFNIFKNNADEIK